jgi:hypothetical protein
LLPIPLLLSMLGLPAHAQHNPLVIAEREPVEVMLLRVSASSRCLQDCVVSGAPYSAERVSESVQVLADGNRIVQRRSEQLYRDAEGRSRVESEWSGSPLVQIQDPVGNMSWRLYPESRRGLGMALGQPAPASRKAAAAVLPGGGSSAGAARVAEQLAPALAGTAAEQAGTASMPEQQTKRALGTRQMEGVTVDGTLETTTIPAGTAGNTLPIVATVETWHARELKLDLYVKSTDPRYGDRVTRVRNLRRGSPPAGLFAVPADYQVREIARQ